MNKKLKTSAMALACLGLMASSLAFAVRSVHADGGTIQINNISSYDDTNGAGIDLDHDETVDIYVKLRLRGGDEVAMVQNGNTAQAGISQAATAYEFDVADESQTPIAMLYNGSTLWFRSEPEVNEVVDLSDYGAQLSGNIFIFDFTSYEDHGGPEPGPEFDGTAWFVWNCDGGKICRYELTELDPAEVTEDEDHRMTDIDYRTNYIPMGDVVDKDGKATLDVKATLALARLSNGGESFENYYFVWSGQIDQIAGLTTWAEFRDYWAEHFSGEAHYDDLRAFAIDPCGAASGNNIISTNGDRQFRATIYDNSGYYGITNAAKPSDLTYYPAFWDMAFFNPAIDVSNTSPENPAVLLSYLLEPTVIIESDGISSDISKIEIADGTNPSAVEITHVGGKFTLNFKSNFYDRVVFKITNTNGDFYFLMIGRITVDVAGGLYVPTGATEEYELRAHVTVLDGTEYDFVFERTPEYDGIGGQGLEYRAYELAEEDQDKIVMEKDNPKEPVSVVYTVVKAGSTDTRYAGTLAGSGRGTGYVFGADGQSFDTGLSL